jgi:hypothetical protein
LEPPQERMSQLILDPSFRIENQNLSVLLIRTESCSEKVTEVASILRLKTTTISLAGFVTLPWHLKLMMVIFKFSNENHIKFQIPVIFVMETSHKSCDSRPATYKGME